MDKFLTGEWVEVPGTGVASSQVVVCTDGNYVLTASGKAFLVGGVEKSKMRRMDRFVISRQTLQLLFINNNWKVCFESARPGMRLLVPVPPFGPDLLNYATVKLTTLAVKDSSRWMLFDEDGDLINLSMVFYFGENAVSDHGYLSEKGMQILNQMYP